MHRLLGYFLTSSLSRIHRKHSPANTNDQHLPAIVLRLTVYGTGYITPIYLGQYQGEKKRIGGLSAIRMRQFIARILFRAPSPRVSPAL
jgi:hypothetical protein